MAVLIDDPVIIESVRKLAALLRCSEEEAIGRALTAELSQRNEPRGPLQTSTIAPSGPLADSDRIEQRADD
jgi:hypothetical protein